MNHSAVLLSCAVLLAASAGQAAERVWCLAGSDTNRAAAAELSRWRASVKGGGYSILEVRDPSQTGASFDYLLILGDETEMPPARQPFYRWRSTQAESYVTDLTKVDRDSDGLPDAAVGRIPTSDPEAIRRVVRKIIAYESRAPELSDLELPIWMGSPDVGTAADEFASFAMQNTLEREGPLWADRWLLMGNPRDTFSAFGNPQDLLFSRRMAGGGAFSLFMGHGARDWFLSYADGWRSGGYGVRSVRAFASSPDGRAASAPAVIFACDCGNFFGKDECLTESMLLTTGSAVAVIGATTESHPLTNYYSGRALLEHLRGGDHRTLGDFWNAVQRDAFHRSDFLAELLLSGVEGALDNRLDIVQLKRDHVLMYALLGDPATQLRLPRPLDVRWERGAAGDVWNWEVLRPSGLASGELIVGRRLPTAPLERALPENATAEESLRLFEARNGTLRFAETGRLPFASPWKGEATEKGAWRFVVLGDTAIYAAGRKTK